MLSAGLLHTLIFTGYFIPCKDREQKANWWQEETESEGLAELQNTFGQSKRQKFKKPFKPLGCQGLTEQLATAR